MKENIFETVNEKVYKETLDNGIDVYLYPTNKTKNFYISISVKYGARITKYKVDNEVVNVIPGSAHFLEHKVMALSENKEVSKRINELGSLANAWTNYYGTNYNIFGSINLIENLKLLLDIFYNTNINEKCVNEEKGIIGEEIDMYKDDINSFLYYKLFDNLFNKSYVKHTVVGERSDIEGITAKSLNRIYDDYYSPNNTFIIVTGNFDKDDVIEVIHEYMDKLKLKKKNIPKRITEKESNEVCVSYEEIKKDSDNIRVKYAIKMNKKLFNIKSDTLLRYYVSIILSSNFSSSSALYEKYKNEDLIINMSSGVNIIDDYLIVIINATCKDGDKFINALKSDIKHLSLNKKSFERKKKLFIKSYILDFDNLEDVEYNICESILMDGFVDYKELTHIKEMNYEVASSILSKFDYENVSILRTIK